jgi:hypothetical protein
VGIGVVSYGIVAELYAATLMTRSTVSPAEDADAASNDAARAVLMIRPAAFGRNEVTRPTNPFQATTANADPDRIADVAVKEFDAAAATLRRHGIDVQEHAGRTTTRLPDEVFPNNWISTHPDGTVVLYPMMAWNRRQERRRDILEQLQQQAEGFRIDRLIDLSHLEQEGTFLEGTGSLVFDHASRLAFAGLSPRTHTAALRAFGRATDYGIVTFDARDSQGLAIYHTNVMMSVGEAFAVVCLDSIAAVDERLRLLTRLERSGREVIEIRVDQLKSFCGNLLQLRSGDRRLIVLSRQAYAAFDDRQLEALQRHGELVTVNIRTIETNGGGSIRCMLAELFLPRKTVPGGTISVD